MILANHLFPNLPNQRRGPLGTTYYILPSPTTKHPQNIPHAEYHTPTRPWALPTPWPTTSHLALACKPTFISHICLYRPHQGGPLRCPLLNRL